MNSVVTFVDESHVMLLLGVPYRCLGKRKDRPPWSDQMFEIDIQIQLLLHDRLRYLVRKKDRPTWLRSYSLSC